MSVVRLADVSAAVVDGLDLIAICGDQKQRTSVFHFMNEVTRILNSHEPDDPQGAGELLKLVCSDLRRPAAVRMAAEKAGHTLQATALVHEAWLRLGAMPLVRYRTGDYVKLPDPFAERELPWTAVEDIVGRVTGASRQRDRASILHDLRKFERGSGGSLASISRSCFGKSPRPRRPPGANTVGWCRRSNEERETCA